MTTPSKPSPAPWRWDAEEHSRNVLRAADGDTIATYDEAYLRPRGETDVVNRALIASAPEMAAMLRELEWSCFSNGITDGEDHWVECCPICEAPGPTAFARYVRSGVPGLHTPDCRLAALLRDLP